MLPSSSSRGPATDAQLLCGYSSHLCSREKIGGNDYCLRHILDDRSSPFKQCNFTYNKTNPPRRCPRPAPKSDRKDGFCMEHSRRALIARQRKRPAISTAGGSTKLLLDDLAHYKVPKKEEDVKPPENDDLLDNLAKRIPSMNQRAFDGSEMDSDDDLQTLDTTWNGNEDNSDAESVDSEMDNPLKHAGKYSAEEVVRIMREKLVRLQKLYIDQFQRLRYLLREEGRKYKHNVLVEKEAELSSIHSQIKATNEDLSAYEKVKALNHYQRPQGMEAVLHHAFLERRSKLCEAQGSSSTSNPGPVQFKPTVLPKCSFHITSSTKCGETVIPSSKFCIKHILEDSSQVLFRACGYVANSSGVMDRDGPCETPIADVLEGTTCVFHTQFQNPFTTREVADSKKPNTDSLEPVDVEAEAEELPAAKEEATEEPAKEDPPPQTSGIQEEKQSEEKPQESLEKPVDNEPAKDPVAEPAKEQVDQPEEEPAKEQVEEQETEKPKETNEEPAAKKD